MARYEVNFRVSKDVDWYETFLLKDNSGLIDLTGAEFKLTLSFKDVPQRVMTVNQGITILNSQGGEFAIDVKKGGLDSLLLRQYEHVLIVTLGGFVSRQWVGTLLLEK